MFFKYDIKLLLLHLLTFINFRVFGNDICEIQMDLNHGCKISQNTLTNSCLVDISCNESKTNSLHRLEFRAITCKEPLMINLKLYTNTSVSSNTKESIMLNYNITNNMDFDLKSAVTSFLFSSDKAISNPSIHKEQSDNTSKILNQTITYKINKIALNALSLKVKSSLHLINTTHIMLNLKPFYKNRSIINVIMPITSCKSTLATHILDTPTTTKSQIINNNGNVIKAPFCTLEQNTNHATCGPNQFCNQLNITSHLHGDSTIFSNHTGVCHCLQGYVRYHPIVKSSEVYNATNTALTCILNASTLPLNSTLPNEIGGNKSNVAIAIVVSIGLAVIFALSAVAILNLSRKKSYYQSSSNHQSITEPLDAYDLTGRSLYSDIMNTISRRVRRKLGLVGHLRASQTDSGDPFQTYGHNNNDGGFRRKNASAITYTPLGQCGPANQYGLDDDTSCVENFLNPTEPSQHRSLDETRVDQSSVDDLFKYTNQNMGSGFRIRSEIADEPLLDLSTSDGDLLVSFK